MLSFPIGGVILILITAWPIILTNNLGLTNLSPDYKTIFFGIILNSVILVAIGAWLDIKLRGVRYFPYKLSILTASLIVYGLLYLLALTGWWAV